MNDKFAKRFPDIQKIVDDFQILYQMGVWIECKFSRALKDSDLPDEMKIDIESLLVEHGELFGEIEGQLISIYHDTEMILIEEEYQADYYRNLQSEELGYDFL